MALPQISSADQAKLQLMQEMEIEMMSDLYNRMTNACHKKCIPPRYSESELGEFYRGIVGVKITNRCLGIAINIYPR